MPRPPLRPEPWICPKCGNDDERMVEQDAGEGTYFCNLCAHEYGDAHHPALERRESRVAEAPPAAPGEIARFASLEQLIAATGIRRDELATLAEIGALNAFGYDRREALWQIERAVRPAGELFEETLRPALPAPLKAAPYVRGDEAAPSARPSPLQPMTPLERVIADYDGTGLTIGPHPMSLRRPEMALRGVLCASDLPRARAGRRVRVAGAVITRQRPGTAKGFVFLTLEDETGIANVIVRPDLFDTYRVAIVGEPFLLVEGVLQQQDAVTSVKAERVYGLGGDGPEIASHDFR